MLNNMNNNISQDIQLLYNDTQSNSQIMPYKNVKFHYTNDIITLNNIDDIKLHNLNSNVSSDLIRETLELLENIDTITNTTYDLQTSVLKKIIIRWLSLDDEIKKISATLKDYKSEKQQIETKILQYMKDTNKSEINTSEGKIKKKISESKESMNETYIRNSLCKLIDNNDIIEQLTTILLNNRNIKLNYKLCNNKL